MKIYMAGKISGDPDYKAKFEAAERELKNRFGEGARLLNPAMLPEGMSKKDYMSICLQMLCAADVVALLWDWPESPGACIEYQLAAYIGTDIVFLYEEESDDA